MAQRGTTTTNERRDSDDVPPKGPADFEQSLKFAGFGAFNIMTLMICIPISMAVMFTGNAMSFVMPNAECDFGLSLVDKGILHGLPFAGMIFSAIIWGYVSDRVGRKYVTIAGFAMDALFAVGTAASQNFTILVIFRFLSGCAISGAFAIMLTYLSELCAKKYRNLIMLSTGMMSSISMVILPLLAMAIIPQDIEFDVGPLKFYTWQSYLLICSIPGILGTSLLLFLPESPKFLMTHGRNEEAMAVFQTIYSMNFRKPRDTYPITELIDELALRRQTVHKGWRKRLEILRPMFEQPLLSLSIQFYLLNFCLLLGHNTFRLWLPQIFSSLEEFRTTSNTTGMDINLCDILAFSVKQNENARQHSDSVRCDTVKASASYSNNVIAALVNVVAFIISIAVLRRVGVKRILNSCLMVCAVCGICLYFLKSELAILIVACFYFSNSSISAMLVITACVNLFPTTVRSLVVSLTIIIGRIGTVCGNVLFPLLMDFGCIPPLLLIGSIMSTAFLMSLFMPHADNIAMV